MKLFKHCFQLCGNRQTEVASVLDEGHTLVGNVKENDGSTQYRAGTDNLCVNDVADADKGKDMLYCQMSDVAEDVAEIVTPLAVMLEVESDTVGAVRSMVSSVIVVLAVIELMGVPL